LQRTSTNQVLRNLAGSATSPDDDRAEHSPVRLAGVEQRSDPVVLEVTEPEADPFDALDQVVERFGRTVGHPGQVEVAIFSNQALRVRPSFWISGGMVRRRQCCSSSLSIALASSGSRVR